MSPSPSIQPLSTTCLSHIAVTVSDLEASVAFYTQVLGFVRRYDNVNEGWTRVGIALADTVIELFSPYPGQVGDDVDPFYPTPFGRPKIALTVIDVETAFAQLSAAGIAPLCPITSTSQSRFFLIADPDGTPIQLHQFLGGRQRLAELFG